MTFYLRLTGAVGGFLIASIYGVAIAVLRRDRSLVPRDYARLMRRLTHPALGLRVEVEGQEHLTAERPCVYVVNHQSAFDVPVLAGLYPEGTVLIAKKELRKIPLFGWLYEATGNILIDRRNNAQAVQRLREAEDAIGRRGVSIWVFPEGTRGSGGGELLPFKKGAFYMAVAAQVAVVPIVVSPMRETLDLGRRTIRPGTIHIRILPPVPTVGLEEADVNALLKRVHRQMEETLLDLGNGPGAESARPQLA